MDPKLLTESGWKTTAQKFKVKDNGLQRALASYENLEDDQHDERLSKIGSVSQLAGSLKKDKAVAANPVVVKYLADVLSAAEAKQQELAKAKLMAAKTEAMTRKKAETEAKNRDPEEEEEEEEQGAYHVKLMAAFQKLKGSRDLSYQFIICDAKPHCGLMLAKRITSKHKEELSRVTGGSKRFLHVGTCHSDNGRFTFTMDKPVTGLARKLQDSIKHFTGKKLPILVGTESADDEEPGSGEPGASGPGGHHGNEKEAAAGKTAGTKEAEPPVDMKAPVALSGSVGRGGKNKAEDVQAVQAALNRRAKAGLEVDGKCGPKTIAAITAFQKSSGMRVADGLIEPGKGTERALNGEAAGPEKPEPGKEPGGGGGTSKPSPAMSPAIEAAMKAAKEIADRKAEADQWYQDAIKKLKQIGEQQAGDEGKRIKQELEKAYNETREHIKKVEEAAKALAQHKTEEAAKALKEAAEKSIPGFKRVEEQAQKTFDWLRQKAPGLIDDAKTLAKKVTQEVADRKKQADQAYKDAIDKLKKAAEKEAGEEGKKIKDELEKAYKENQEHIKKVAEAAKELLKRETEQAAEALKKAAEKTVPGFQTVEDMAQKARDWWNS